MTSKPEDKLTEYKLIEGCVKGDRRSQELLYHLFAKKNVWYMFALYK